MTETLWRYVIVGLLVVHGVGHTLGWWFLGHSWLLSDLVGGGALRVIGLVLWALVAIGYLGAAMGLWVYQGWWRPVAITMSAISLAGLLAFWDVWPPNKFPAFAVDIGILVALIWAHWPSPDLVGA
ncbi:MAG TPA: hypothetical protein VFZ66_13350 [Herpetosiphonaceae bacterium]